MANKKIYRWIALGAAVLALLALIMAFVPTVSLNIGTETKKFSAFSVAFGGIIATESGATLKFTFNFVGFIAIILFVPGLYSQSLRRLNRKARKRFLSFPQYSLSFRRF